MGVSMVFLLPFVAMIGSNWALEPYGPYGKIIPRIGRRDGYYNYDDYGDGVPYAGSPQFFLKASKTIPRLGRRQEGPDDEMSWDALMQDVNTYLDSKHSSSRKLPTRLSLNGQGPLHEDAFDDNALASKFWSTLWKKRMENPV